MCLVPASADMVATAFSFLETYRLCPMKDPHTNVYLSTDHPEQGSVNAEYLADRAQLSIAREKEI